ncbi:hypothetical protein [Hymenobacter sp. BT188]|nr:hypothetical protein [Hymenobacter sp. BT188]
MKASAIALIIAQPINIDAVRGRGGTRFYFEAGQRAFIVADIGGKTLDI